MPSIYPLIATLLLTGGRPREVLGLEIEDVSLTRKTIIFRPHAARRLKNTGSHRVVRLWPQLEQILRACFPERERLGTGGGLLFPSPRTGGMLDGLPRKLLKALAKRAELGKKVTPYMFRHSYCAARLQTLDGGALVSPYTVGKELGHGGDAMVRRVYGHLGTVRKRGRVAEYLVPVCRPLRHTSTPAKSAKLLRRP